MIAITDPPRASLDELVATAPDHLRPIYEAVRAGRCNFGFVPQLGGEFAFPCNKPVFALVGDDFDEALGPDAFDIDSLGGFIAGCVGAAIVAGAPPPALYAGLVVMAMSLGRNVVLVETRPEHEADWANLIQTVHPGLPTMISSPRSPSSAAH